MPINKTCATVEQGRIKIFTKTSLLARYLKVDNETVYRWRRRLKKEGKPLVWSYESILIDFEPEIINNQS
jgi:hypothetical protein